MSPEVLLRLVALVPFIYAGLYSLTDPASSIRIFNRVVEQAHQIESSTILGGLFDQPAPVEASRTNQLLWRAGGLLMMAAGLTRLYFL